MPEELSKLSVDRCHDIQVPNILACGPAIAEKEYDRDPHKRFAPRTFEQEREFRPQRQQARDDRKDIPIYVPSLELHLNH